VAVAATATAAAVLLSPLVLVATFVAGLVASFLFRDIERRLSIQADATSAASSPQPDPHLIALVFSPDGELINAGAMARQLLGWNGTEATPRYGDLPHPDDHQAATDALDAVAALPLAEASVAVRIRTAESWRSMQLTIVNATEIEDIAGFHVTLRDITAIVEANESAAGHARALESLHELIDGALEDHDETTLLQSVVTVVRTALHADAAELYRSSGSTSQLVYGIGPGAIALDRRSLAADGVTLADQAMRSSGPVHNNDEAQCRVAVPSSGPDPDTALVLRSGNTEDFTDADVSLVQSALGIAAMARRQRGAEQEAFRRSQKDDLTGLVNRESFIKRLRTSLTRAAVPGEMVAVLLIDLDHFNVVNDSLGHASGDTLIEAVSHRVTAGLRPGDTLARFGGDEFVVLMRGLGNANQATLGAQRIQSQLLKPFRVSGHDVQVTASIGVAAADDPDTDADVLIQRADAAMGTAKAQGRERVVSFEPSMLEAAVARLRTEEELRTALVAGQLRVFYQPIVDLNSGHTTSAEALVRWIHPGRGLVTPAEFIPISEATGLIEEIGAWVIGEACAQAAEWRDAGNPIQVSVNIASRQLEDPNLLTIVDAALEQHDLEPEWLAVELTETTATSNSDIVSATLHGLSERGVTIAIDDFGKGYSSLFFLKNLPVHLVKIDRAFVEGIDRSGDDYAVMAAIIRLVQTLGKQVVAEGVETEQQLELLRDLGCDFAQGFLFSPAVYELEHGTDDQSWSELVLEPRR
jgi:diguanylate cyclase (GGDEF)-like protein